MRGLGVVVVFLSGCSLLFDPASESASQDAAAIDAGSTPDAMVEGEADARVPDRSFSFNDDTELEPFRNLSTGMSMCVTADDPGGIANTVLCCTGGYDGAMALGIDDAVPAVEVEFRLWLNTIPEGTTLDDGFSPFLAVSALAPSSIDINTEIPFMNANIYTDEMLGLYSEPASIASGARLPVATGEWMDVRVKLNVDEGCGKAWLELETPAEGSRTIELSNVPRDTVQSIILGVFRQGANAGTNTRCMDDLKIFTQDIGCP